MEATGRVLKRGTVYLQTDRRERKATGSYYTPDYIVKYIVQHTVGPVLEEKFEALRPKLRKVQQSRRAFRQKRPDELRRRGLPPEPDEKEKLIGERLVEELFDIRVLDPAMGSGHFLVEAVDFITDRMLDFLNAFPHNPVVDFLERTRAAILTDMQRQDVTIDARRLTRVNLLKRHVLKRCIYGVDLNPMAVELAKVSLWLDCFTLGAPLSFLDHHLRCGNSLIGVTVEEVREALGEGEQLQLLRGRLAGVMMAAELMERVGRLPDVTSEQVDNSRREYRHALAEMEPYKLVLDVYTSQWFTETASSRSRGRGKRKGEQVSPAIRFLRSDQADIWLERIRKGQSPEEAAEGLEDWARAVVLQAIEAAEEHRFFHWELEFPEVFSPGTHHVGFDAAIGNPPYGADVSQQGHWFTRERYIHASNQDGASLFLERGTALVHPKGTVGMIVPKSLSFYTDWDTIRSFILDTWGLIAVGDAGLAFPDVNYETIVICGQVGGPTTGRSAICYWEPSRHPTAMKELVPCGMMYQELMRADNVLTFRGLSQQEETIVSKLARRSIRLREIAEDIFRGIYIPDAEKQRLRPGKTQWVDKVPDVGRYEIKRIMLVTLPQKYRTKAEEVMRERLFFKVLRGLQLISYYDTGELATTEKLVNVTIRTDSGWHPAAVVAVVNGCVPSFYVGKVVFSMTTETSRVMDAPYSGRVPLPRIDFSHSTTSNRTALVEKTIQTLANGNPEAALSTVRSAIWAHAALYGPGGMAELREQEPWRTWIKQADTSFPGREDFVHDLLAELAKRMTQLKRQKREEMDRFLSWLESQLRIIPNRQGKTGIDAFTGKTTILEYPGDYYSGKPERSWEEIEDVLRRNRSRIGRELDERGFLKRLRERYEESLDAIRPIEEQLRRTDWLIDQIVYLLYGLTEEEIELIERTVRR